MRTNSLTIYDTKDETFGDLLERNKSQTIHENNLHKLLVQFGRIHKSSLINTEKTLNRPITKFCNGDDVNVIAAEMRLSQTRQTSFNMKHNLL